MSNISKSYLVSLSIFFSMVIISQIISFSWLFGSILILINFTLRVVYSHSKFKQKIFSELQVTKVLNIL